MTVIMTGRGTHMKEIRDACGFARILRNSTGPIRLNSEDIFINYGLQGERLQTLITRLIPYPNLPVGMKQQKNKYDACMALKDVPGMNVPKCWKHNQLPTSSCTLGGFLRKPLFSEGGNDITVWNGDNQMPSQYYLQERIYPRRYELRVHAARWIPISDWLVSKKMHPEGENAVTWNHETGGSFSNIDNRESNTGVFARAKQCAFLALHKLGHEFGAVDFVVRQGDNPLVPWFLEVNLSPGFSTDTTKEWYVNTFRSLSQLPGSTIRERLELTPTPVENVERRTPEVALQRPPVQAPVAPQVGLSADDKELIREALTFYHNNYQFNGVPAYVKRMVATRIGELVAQLRR